VPTPGLKTCALPPTPAIIGRRRHSPWGKEKPIRPPQWKPTAENIIDYLSDLKNYPDEGLAPYEEFRVGGKTYYFTPGGSLYRKEEDSGTEEGGGFLRVHTVVEDCPPFPVRSAPFP
jgi:hypothetical protein